MATEYERDGKRMIQPKIASWKLKQRERLLYGEAEIIPNWRLADKSRRFLADTTSHLSPEIPSQVGKPLKEFDRQAARQFAVVAASGIAVRSAGSAVVLVAAGYAIESAGPFRRILESKLHAQAIKDDQTGEYALRFLQGQGTGISKLAQRYGQKEEVELLSTFAHADASGLRLLQSGARRGSGEVSETEINVLPAADPEKAASILYLIGYETVGIAVLVAEVFGVGLEIPPWISSELKRLKAASEALRQPPAPGGGRKERK
ncbi:MAG: hypothetical protein ACTHLH_03270 [Solirubrobacterales bacterium]